MTLARRAVVEAPGTAFLLMVVVGSGIMGERLAGGNVALALLASSLATGAGLVALILTFGPVSGAHFNPAVTGSLAWRGFFPSGPDESWLVERDRPMANGATARSALRRLRRPRPDDVPSRRRHLVERIPFRSSASRTRKRCSSSTLPSRSTADQRFHSIPGRSVAIFVDQHHLAARDSRPVGRLGYARIQLPNPGDPGAFARQAV